MRVSPHFSSSRGIHFVKTPPPPWEVLSILWDLQTKVINRNNFSTVFWRNQVSPGISPFSNPMRVSPHFSSSCGFHFVQTPTPHEKSFPSRWIYRLKLLIEIIFPLYFEEIKFLLGSHHFQIPWEFLPISPHLVGSHKMGRSSPGGGWGMVLNYQIPWEFLAISPNLVGFS